MTAAVLFLGVTGSMGTLGAFVFEETGLAVYGSGVAAGAGWLSFGTYRTSRAEAGAQDKAASRS
jgi:hypothetical protein